MKNFLKAIVEHIEATGSHAVANMIKEAAYNVYVDDSKTLRGELDKFADKIFDRTKDILDERNKEQTRYEEEMKQIREDEADLDF